MIANVLVVDDEPQVGHSIAQLLEIEGYKCRLAYDSAQARSYLRENTFDLILCDMYMPGESGLDFSLDVLKHKPETAIVMVTAVDDPDLAATALKMGIYGYIVKPFKPNELLINVSNALHRRDLEAQNRLYQENLEKMVHDRTEELRVTFNDLQKALQAIVQATVLTIESSDPYTGHSHIDFPYTGESSVEIPLG